MTQRAMGFIELSPARTFRSYSPTYIFRMAYWLKMIWVHAECNSTLMVDLKTIRYFANELLV